MRVSIIVQNVKMSWIQEIAVFRVTEIDYSAFLWLVIDIEDFNTFVTIFSNFHTTDSVESYKASSWSFSFVIPMLTSISIVTEKCGESISFLRSWSRIACNSCISNLSMWNSNFNSHSCDTHEADDSCLEHK